MELTLTGNFFRKFGYTSVDCLLFRKLCKTIDAGGSFLRDLSALVIPTSFPGSLILPPPEASEVVVIQGKHDCDMYWKIDLF